MTWAIRKFFDKEFKVMEFTTPLPPSVNEYLGKRVIYVQGKPRVQLYETTDARAFKRHVGNIIKRKMEEIDWEKTGEFEYVICEVVMYLSQKKRDADNHFKCLLDAITASGAIYDDSMVIPRVEDVIIDKENPRVEVRLYRAEKIGVFTNEFALNNFIEKAEGLKAEDYTEESFGNLNKALEEARSLVGVANSQEEINSMLNKLKDAINNLKSKENVDEKVPNPSEKPENSTKPGNGNSNNSGMLPKTGIESGPWGIIAIVSIILGAMLIYRRSNKIIE